MVTKSTFLAGLCLAALMAGGCSSETLFRSNFDANPDNQPPAHAQDVGTVNVDGPPGSVVVVPPPVTPSGKWVRISRATSDSPVAGLQGNAIAQRGDGTYTFSATMFIPAGSGLATIQFEPFNQPVSTLTSFLHIDFMKENDVRIDDNENMRFGSFTRAKPFIVQVTLTIGPTSTAHIVLSGDGASGTADATVAAPFRPMARQFGAVRAWMGFPWTGSFQVTTMAITRRTN